MSVRPRDPIRLLASRHGWTSPEYAAPQLLGASCEECDDLAETDTSNQPPDPADVAQGPHVPEPNGSVVDTVTGGTFAQLEVDTLPTLSAISLAQGVLEGVALIQDRENKRFLRARERLAINRDQVTRTVDLEFIVSPLFKELEDTTAAKRLPPEVDEDEKLLPLLAVRRGHHLTNVQISSNHGNCRIITRRLNDQITRQVIYVAWHRTFNGWKLNEDGTRLLADLAEKALSIPSAAPEVAEEGYRDIQRHFAHRRFRGAPGLLALEDLIKYLSRRYILWVCGDFKRSAVVELTYVYTRELDREQEMPQFRAISRNPFSQFGLIPSLARRFFNQTPNMYQLEIGLPYLSESYHFYLNAPEQFFVSEQHVYNRPASAPDARGIKYIRATAKQFRQAVEQQPGALYESRGRRSSSSVDQYLSGLDSKSIGRLYVWLFMKERPPGTTGAVLTVTVLSLTLSFLVFLGYDASVAVDGKEVTFGQRVDPVAFLVALPSITLAAVAALIPRGDQAQFQTALLSRTALTFSFFAMVSQIFVLITSRIIDDIPLFSGTPAQAGRLYQLGLCIVLALFSLALLRRRIRVSREYWR